MRPSASAARRGTPPSSNSCRSWPKRDWCAATKSSAHIYETTRPREWTQRQLAGDLLQRAFGGSAKSLVMGALSARKASREELAEIRKLLDQFEKESR